MSEKGNQEADKYQVNATGWCLKFIGHVMGGSALLLPYAMGQSGIILFIVLLIVQLYVTGNSLVVFCEMAHDKEIDNAKQEKEIKHDNNHLNPQNMAENQPDEGQMITQAEDEKEIDQANSSACPQSKTETQLDGGGKMTQAEHAKEIDHVNYFNIVENHISGGQTIHYVIRCTFILDFVICSVIYFKLTQELFLSHFDDMISSEDKPGYGVLVFFGTALFLVIGEFVSRRYADPHSQCQSIGSTGASSHQKNQLIFNDCNVNSVCLDDSSRDSKEKWELNLSTVLTELHGYNSLRFFLLLLFVILNYALLSSSWTSWNEHNQTESNVTINLDLKSNYSQCPGLRKLFLWPDMGVKVLHTVSAINFALMHYSIFLPICLEELKLPVEKYSRLVKIASAFLLVILIILPLLAHFTFGESAPVVFTSGYGHSVHGEIIFSVTLGITLVAMLMRINACCKLVQVLFDWKSSSHFDIITICVFLFSSWIVFMVQSVLHVVIITGLVTGNFLLIIFPRIAFIYFKRGKGERWMSSVVFPTVLCAAIHCLFLPLAVPAIQFANLKVGQHCSDIFNPA